MKSEILTATLALSTGILCGFTNSKENDVLDLVPIPFRKGYLISKRGIRYAEMINKPFNIQV